jgi:SAM-dependent methyltransferase
MLPRTSAQEKKHRQSKRTREVSLIVDTIAARLTAGPKEILEFGSGNGFQIPFLARLGRVTATDIYESADIAGMPNVEFVRCSISSTPFADARFDLLFSNHVIEHIDDLPKAFREMQRIGKADCLYAFSVPTNVWLLLSIPASYYDKVRRRFGYFRNDSNDAGEGGDRGEGKTAARQPRRRGMRRLLHSQMPAGHGLMGGFGSCYRHFRIESWQRLFTSNGFKIVETKPLLLYGPSQFPVVPTTRSVVSLCSSVLFLLRKRPAPG